MATKDSKGVKQTIFNLLHVFLWLSFLCAINDPGFEGTRPVGSIYNTFGFVLNIVYTISHNLTFPFELILSWMGAIPLNDKTGWFPSADSQEVGQFFTSLGWTWLAPYIKFDGVLNLWIPVGSLGYIILDKSIMLFWDPIRNWGWNLFIEYGFQRKQIRTYTAELEKRSNDLERLNKQYRALKQETNSLQDSVITDELTQVFNKRFFLNRLKQEFDLCVQQRTNISLIMVDIDYFKRLNDTYGHMAGDDVLVAVGQVLKKYTPEKGFPCRYGGEEFGIILPRLTLQQSVEIARKIQEGTQQLRFHDIDVALRVTLSQGICAVDFARPESRMVKSIDDLLRLADQELYRSKLEGRNRVSVYTLIPPGS